MVDPIGSDEYIDLCDSWRIAGARADPPEVTSQTPHWPAASHRKHKVAPRCSLGRCGVRSRWQLRRSRRSTM